MTLDSIRNSCDDFKDNPFWIKNQLEELDSVFAKLWLQAFYLFYSFAIVQWTLVCFRMFSTTRKEKAILLTSLTSVRLAQHLWNKSYPLIVLPHFLLFMNAILHLIVCQNHLYADDLLFSCQDIFCSLSKVVNLSNLKSFQRSWHFVLSRNSILKLHLNFLHVRLLSLFSFKKNLGAKTSPQVGI